MEEKILQIDKLRIGGFLKSLGLSYCPLDIRDIAGRQFCVPLTKPYNYASTKEYSGSPRRYSINRQLQNAFLGKLKAAGLFESGQWLDVGGDPAYGDWLQVPRERYRILNLQKQDEATIAADIQNSGTIDFSNAFDGSISLNCLYMLERPEMSLKNMMRLLKPGGFAVLDFTAHHYWYVSNDGDHWNSFNPFRITRLVAPYLDDFVIVPLGNLFQAACEHYARRRIFRPLASLIRGMGMQLGRLDKDPRTAMSYMVLGTRRKDISF